MSPHNVVYSTDPNFSKSCPRCRRDKRECVCPPPPEVPPADQTARISREKRKGGKEVTVVAALAPGAALEKLAKELRAKCGAGGTLKDGEIEVQGDHREKIAALLRERGYAVKMVGG